MSENIHYHHHFSRIHLISSHLITSFPFSFFSFSLSLLLLLLLLLLLYFKKKKIFTYLNLRITDHTCCIADYYNFLKKGGFSFRKLNNDEDEDENEGLVWKFKKKQYVEMGDLRLFSGILLESVFELCLT